jgi:hypothetical protein
MYSEYNLFNLQSLTVHDLYVGEGTDRTGVPMKLITLNSSLGRRQRSPWRG